MEKQPHQEYRNNLAKELKDIRSSESESSQEDAQKHLEEQKETEEYEKAQENHRSEEKQTDDFSLEEGESKSDYEKVLEVFKEGGAEKLLDSKQLVSKDEVEAEMDRSGKSITSFTEESGELYRYLDFTLFEDKSHGTDQIEYHPSLEVIQELCEKFKGKPFLTSAN